MARLPGRCMSKVVDVHNHFYPAAYLEALTELDSDVSVGTDEEGRDVIYSGGSRIVTLTDPMTDVETRLDDVAAAGVDHQVVSLTAPNVNFLGPDESVELARACNDAYADLQTEYEQFSTLASVPLLDPAAAVTEAERAIDDLGLKGFLVGSNVAGTPLDDEAFEPFYEAVARLDVPIFVHPMTPAGVEVMGEYRLAPLVGFENEVTMAVARLVFDGVLERHDIDLHLAHLGGTVPYLVERLNNGYRAYPECRRHIDRLPGTYLEEVYYDTVSFHPPALRCAVESVGASQLLAGSDYPHVIGDLERTVSDVDELRLTAGEREAIRHENAAALYDL